MALIRPFRPSLLMVLACGLLAACTQTELVMHTAKQVQRLEALPGTSSPGTYKVGRPYQVAGRWYYPAEDYDYNATGIASWYGRQFHGRKTANGELYDMNALTAAHKTLPLSSAVRVTNLENGRSIVLRVNDRGPFVDGRIIDVSRRGAQLLGFQGQGTARVRVSVLAQESLRLKLAALNAPGNKALQLAAQPAPRLPVETRILPPPGAGSAPLADNELLVAAVRIEPRATPALVRAAPVVRAPARPLVLPSNVEILPVSPSGIYVQTGAFGELGNALRMRDRLYRDGIGPAQISRVDFSEGSVFRVRVGPVGSVEEADGLLARIVGAGVEEARLIVE